MSTLRWRRVLAASLLVVLMGSACSSRGAANATAGTTTGNATPSTSSPAPSPSQAAPACPARDLPAGFTPDAAHSGGMDPGQYSQSGDMQAAMIYDGYRSGVRAVYTNLKPVAGGDPDLVIECIVMQFQAPSGAAQFIAAFKALREQAGSLAQSQTPIASVGASTLQYAETGQSFSGYGITSTNVAEMASQDGARFSSIVVAGPNPPPQLAVALLRDLVAQP